MENRFYHTFMLKNGKFFFDLIRLLKHFFRSAPLNGLDKNTPERKSSGNRTCLGADSSSNNLTASGKPRGKRGGRAGPVEKRIKNMNHGNKFNRNRGQFLINFF